MNNASGIQDIKRARIITGLLFLLLAIMVPRAAMQFDREYWVDWALYIHRHDLANIYQDPMADYHPLYYYIIQVYDWFQTSEAGIVNNIHYLKIITLVFDFLPVVALCCFRQRIVDLRIPYLFLLLNIAYLFNTYIWGQVDSIYTCFVFFALLLGFSRPVWSALFFALALAMKPQPIVFLPMVGIAWLYGAKSLRTWLSMFFVISITWFIVVLPFTLSGNLPLLWHVLTTNVGRYPRVAVGAFNIWYLIIGNEAYNTMDSQTFFILSYKQAGLLLFLISSGLALLPLLFRVLQFRSRKAAINNDTLQMLMLAAGLITLFFFYFNTQMHERYVHPVILFFFFYGVFSKNYKLYVLVSIPYFLSLDKLFPDYLPVVHYKFIWASRVIALWYTATLIYATWEYFKQYKPGEEYRSLREALTAIK